MTTYEIEAEVVRAREGDETAFRRLVDGTANTVCSIALSIVRNVEASEDVAQEVFLAAWRNLRNLRNPSSFLPWLRQVTRNQAHLWRRNHGQEISDELVMATASDPAPSADARLLASETERLLREVLDEIPDEAREVLVLYYREESSTRQVAGLLGLSEPAVRQRVSRARQLVRSEMLERFSTTVGRTSPGAVFGSMVAAALAASAPSVSAAVAMSSSATLGTTAATVAKATLTGGILGWIGVLMGMRALEPAFDEREARDLRRFRNTILVIVTAGCAAVAFSVRSVVLMLVVVQTLYITVACIYALWLPKILRPRLDALRAESPSVARQTRRRWMWSTIAPAAGAAIGGLFLMAVVVVIMR